MYCETCFPDFFIEDDANDNGDHVGGDNNDSDYDCDGNREEDSDDHECGDYDGKMINGTPFGGGPLASS